MAKKSLYLPEAERLFVVENYGFAEIASRLRLGEKTIRLWRDEAKRQGSDWDEKRRQYLASRQSFHEELYEFARSLMRTIRQDIESGNKVDASRMYTLTKLVPNIAKVKDYEDVRQSKEAGAPTGEITGEMLKTIQQTVLGIE